MKSMVLLIDANILLDVLMDRKEFVNDSSLIWKLCETGKAKGYISTLTIANLIYIMRKQLTPGKIDETINLLRMIFEFTDLTVSDINLATKMEWNDFEDAVQSATAQRVHADYLITRSKIPDFTPAELLARI